MPGLLCPAFAWVLGNTNSGLYGKSFTQRPGHLSSPKISFLYSYLDDKIHIASVFITGDRSVRPDDQIAINSGREVDMLAWEP